MLGSMAHRHPKTCTSIVAIAAGIFVLLDSPLGADSRLFEALRANDLGAVMRVLASGADPNETGDRGGTPLMYSTGFSSIDIVTALLAAGARVNAVSDSGSTALMWGAADEEKVRLLIDRGASVDARGKAGVTPLMVAARHQAVGAMRELIARGALAGARDDDLRTYAAIAYSRESPGVLDALLAAGVNPQPADTAAAAMLVPNLSNAAMVRRLLASGAKPGLQLRLGTGGITTPLLGAAAFHGDADVVGALVDAGLDVNAAGTRGYTPLMMAAAADAPAPAIVRLLIERGARTDPRDENSMTALDWALTQGETPVARVLREAGTPLGMRQPAAPEPAAKPRTTRDAVAAAIARLQPASPAFTPRPGGCVSCHHQSLPAIAVALARARGVPVDAKLAAHPAEATMQMWAPRAERSQQGEGLLAIPFPNIAYGLWQFAEERVPANPVIDAVLVGLATAQRADGTWRAPDVRPPLSDGSAFHYTALAIRALKRFAPPALRPEMDARIARGVQALRAETPTSTQDEAFKLLGLLWAEASPREIAGRADRLQRLQRSSGGWGQLPTMAPDAYATGQALYALGVAGMSPSTASYEKGVRYLLDTQLADGTWYVRSRAFGFQPYFDAGFPHGRDQFISAAATAWAAMALSRALPVQSAAVDSRERNKEAVRRHFVAVNSGDTQRMGESWADRDVRNNGIPLAPGTMQNVVGTGGLIQMYPDWRVDIDELIAEGETVVVRYRASGTHKGVAKVSFGGMPVGTPPTGNRFDHYRHIHIYKMRDGKFVDHYPARDDVGMLRQLGLLPQPTGAQPAEHLTGPLGYASDSAADVRRPSVPPAARATREELERNKELVRRHVMRIAAGDVDGAVSDWMEQDLRFNGKTIAGRAAIRAGIDELLRVFPDWTVAIDELIAEGDAVVVRYRASGTHRGTSKSPLASLLADTLPTGRSFQNHRQIHIYKVRDGKLVDHYPARDDLALMRQLGLLPANFMRTAVQ
jgi:ankyrin repeat protein/predicted ester cyclase